MCLIEFFLLGNGVVLQLVTLEYEINGKSFPKLRTISPIQLLSVLYPRSVMAMTSTSMSRV
jgi:hypothetical protein